MTKRLCVKSSSGRTIYVENLCGQKFGELTALSNLLSKLVFANAYQKYII